MNTDSDIWLAFARTFSMLFVVLALLVLVFYLVKRISNSKTGGMCAGQLIKVLAVHHISPKEKFVLVKALDEVVLVGVTPGHISRISTLDAAGLDLSEGLKPSPGSFAGLLGRAMGKKEAGIPAFKGGPDDA